LIDTIIADYGGVLIALPSRAENIANMAKTLGFEPEMLKLGINGENSASWDSAKLGEITESAYWHDVGERLGLPADKVDWIKQQLFEEVEIRQAFWDTLKGLKDRHSHHLGILSNAIPSFSDKWAELNFGDIFEVMVNSSDVGMSKPDPRLFALILDRMNTTAERCVFIDDQLKNIEPAAELGFHVVHFVDEAQAIADLKRILET
jgi:putative hydrolase of the HAD superfamily